MGGFSSPVIDGDRIYQADNGGNLYAFDVETGRELWKHPIGTIQKASVVFADGKIYVGSEAGKFFILRPHADRCEVLSEVEMPISDQGLASQKVPEPIVSGAAVARGRVYFVSSDGLVRHRPEADDGPGFEAGDADDGARSGRSRLVAGDSDRAGAQAGRRAAVARAALRRAGPLPAGREGDLVARRIEGHGRRRQVHRGAGQSRPGRIDQSHRRRHHRRSARAGDSAAALERNIRLLPGRRRAARMDQRGRRPGAGERARRPEGFRETAQRDAVQAHPHLQRAVGLVELHRRIRHPHHRKAAPDGRRRHHRAALHAGGVRQQSAPGDEFLAAGNGARGIGAFRLEARHLVSPQAARRKYRRRKNAHTGQGVARGGSRAGRLADRPRRSDSEQAGQSRPVRRRPVRSLFRQL